MSNIFSFEFEELPLVITNGIEAGLINGCAEIQYTRDCEWHIDSVSIEGHQNLTQEERAAGKRPWIYVAAPLDLADMIATRLEGEWSGRVQDAVNQQIAENREEHRANEYDRRRDDAMMR